MENQELSILQAAALLDVSPDFVRKRIISGDIPARKVRGTSHGQYKYLIGMNAVGKLQETLTKTLETVHAAV